MSPSHHERTAHIAAKVVLRLPKTQLELVDIDNQLKHVFDALQGALAGEKRKTRRQ
jgi:hypothetical protein